MLQVLGDYHSLLRHGPLRDKNNVSDTLCTDLSIHSTVRHVIPEMEECQLAAHVNCFQARESKVQPWIEIGTHAQKAETIILH